MESNTFKVGDWITDGSKLGKIAWISCDRRRAIIQTSDGEYQVRLSTAWKVNKASVGDTVASVTMTEYEIWVDSKDCTRVDTFDSGDFVTLAPGVMRIGTSSTFLPGRVFKVQCVDHDRIVFRRDRGLRDEVSAPSKYFIRVTNPTAVEEAAALLFWLGGEKNVKLAERLWGGMEAGA